MKKRNRTRFMAMLLMGLLLGNVFPVVSHAEEVDAENAAEMEVVEGDDLLYGTSANTATALTNGVTVTDGWTTKNVYTGDGTSVYENYHQAHWYKFTTTKRGYVTFNLAKHANTDESKLGLGWKMTVYKSGEATAIDSQDEIMTSYTSKRCCYDAGVTLLVKVEIYSYMELNNYFDLTANQTAVSNWEVEGNDSVATATPFVNGEIYGTSYKLDDADYYSFKVSKKSKLHVTMLFDQLDVYKINTGWNLKIYKAGSSNYISYKDNWCTSDTWTPKSVEYNGNLGDYPELILEPGTYYILVDDAWYDSMLDEAYHLKISLETVESMTMYRMYNPNSGEHFYTADANERDVLKSVGWNYEGIAWTAPKKSNTPVYRLYNKNSGEHHYTTNAAEKNMLIGIGWNDEGIGWYSDDNMTTPLYRLYNPNAKGAQEAGAHHYTVDELEKWHLLFVGWNDEKIGWYGL